MSDEERRLVTVEVELTPEQASWLRAAAKHTGETPDALVRQAIQLLRRISMFRGSPERYRKPGD